MILLTDQVMASVTHRRPIGTQAFSTLVVYFHNVMKRANQTIVFNLFSDLLLALLPVPMVWKLQTNIRTRISLCIILGLGLL